MLARYMAAGLALAGLGSFVFGENMNKSFGRRDPIQIGIGTSVITPTLDTPLAGYYYDRMPDGVHDDLLAKAIVFDDGKNQVVTVSCDVIGIPGEVVRDARARIRKRCGIPPERILISATHTHTGPQMTPKYEEELAQRIADSVLTATGRKRLGYLFAAIGTEPTLAHYRRYAMKDGSVRTNPGFLNPEVVKPTGDIDPSVPVLYVEDEFQRPLLTWINYAMHQDTVGGTWISADYAHPLARFLSRVKGPDMLTVFTIGAAGNINQWDVRKPGPQRGIEFATMLGEVLGAAVVRAYHDLAPVAASVVKAARREISLPIRTVTPDEVRAAEEVLRHPPEEGVDFTLERVAAGRIKSIAERAGKPIETELQAVVVGEIALMGIPGELFTELGKRIKEQSPFPYTFVVELANDSIGYIPTREAYSQKAYEDTSSRLTPGTGERMVESAVELLKSLR